MSGTVYGIDLGTTYSAIARINDFGGADIIPNYEGDQTTPSVVHFEDESNVIVGGEAKRMSVTDPDNNVALIKRSMGTDSPQEFFGTIYSPEAISAMILKELVKAANAESGSEATKVVITVPAYFGVQEREATRQAGQMAGLDVVGIIAEPVAAALSVGIAKSGEKDETILVYDLGGGTFDTTVMKVTSGKVSVVVTDGNRTLGGADWDAALTDVILEKFTADTDFGDEDPSLDDDFLSELRLETEDLKKSLTKKEKSNTLLNFNGLKQKVDVTREEFEQATEHLVAQTIEISKRTVDAAKEKDPGISIDRVILVGGSSRMPMIRAALKEKLGWDVEDSEFDFAVAKGAAIYGQAADEGVLFAEGEDEDAKEAADAAPKFYLGGASSLEVENVLSRGVGTSFVRDVNDKEGYIYFFAHANDSIPMEAEPITAYTITDNQKFVTLKIYEQAGESESEVVDDNRFLKDSDLPLAPNLPAESEIDIIATITGEGLVKLKGRDKASGNEVELEAMVTVLSAEQVEEEAAKVTGLTLRS